MPDPGTDESGRFYPMPIINPPADGGDAPPEGGDDPTLPPPWRTKYPVQSIDGSGNFPIPGRPANGLPEDGERYPSPWPITDPREAGEEQVPEIDPGFGQTLFPDVQQLIDQLIGGIENDQIPIDAVQALVGAGQANKYSVEDINAFAGAGEEVFADDGLNEFTAIDTDPPAGPPALRPDPAKPGSVLQPDADSEDADRGNDLYKSIASQKGSHISPHGKDPKSPPDYDLEDWGGEPWDDSRAAFFKDGVKLKLSSRWGWRYLPTKPKDFHAGIDIAAGVGSEASSIDGGWLCAPIKMLMIVLTH